MGNIYDEFYAGVDESKNNRLYKSHNGRLIVRNISFKATPEALKEHFSKFGSVIEAKLLKKPNGKLVGCGFVHYKGVEIAKEAMLATDKKPFLGRPICVDWAIAKNKYMQHVVTQQIEMEEKVKKVESDSDDDKSSQNISNDDVKQEIKRETDSESDESASDEKRGSSDDVDDDEEDLEDMDENDDEIVQEPEKKRIRLNDAEDGCTVFLSNIPFSVDNEHLREFSEKTGPVKYALICIDKLTEHSKGSGFVKFENKEDADKFLTLPASQLKLEGQAMQVKPALERENLVKGNKKESKDNRNLYLVKEGVVMAGTKAAVGVSSSDMAKRLTLERSKTQMLKNLNRFVSRYRLIVSNLPAHFDDAKLRRVCSAGSQGATITEARVMRDLRSPTGRDGRHPSKGYGFVMFMRHEDALACLRKLNNNPDIFDANNRPIVSFSIEDRKALNARKKRLEKSIANNPLSKKDGETDSTEKRGRKRKQNVSPDESYAKMRKFGKKQRFEQQEEPGKFVKRPKDDEIGVYTGLTAKQGSKHKMRSNQKLRAQAEIHRQTVKMEKKKSMRSIQLKKAARERIKQPKQKINKNKNKKRNKKIKSFDE